MKFRKKQVIVEATQWFKNGDHPEDDVFRPFEDTGKIPTEPREGKVVRYYRHPDVSGQSACKECGQIMHVHGWIDTLEGGHNVCPADWIITGVKGERYPCKPDIFNMTYEAVEEKPKREVIEVKTIEGLYDEKAEAVLMSVNKKRLCWKHDFINASLQWERHVIDIRDKEKESGRLYSVRFESPERKNFNYEWGSGYGGIRFCTNCKTIDCIHCFSKETEYRIVTDEFYSTHHIIAKCEICGRRILRQGWGSYNSDPKSWEIINRVAKELNKPPLGDPLRSPYGSNFYTILPAETSRLMKISEQVAEDYVRGILTTGRCE